MFIFLLGKKDQVCSQSGKQKKGGREVYTLFFKKSNVLIHHHLPEVSSGQQVNRKNDQKHLKIAAMHPQIQEKKM